MHIIAKLKHNAQRLKAEVYILYHASRHPLTPLLAKLVVLAVVAYALSPIDLIPDFIPVLGYLDDVLLLPMGIALALKLIPDSVRAECAAQAREPHTLSGAPWKASLVIIAIWILTLGVVGTWLWSIVSAFFR